jgi:hypothetical protein
MSSPGITTLSAGVQQLYNRGILPSNVGTSTLKNASTSQLNQLASTSVANQEIGTLLGFNNDTATLSSAANNYLSNSNDPLTSAVNESLLAPGTAAADKFLPQNSTTGSQLNVLG